MKASRKVNARKRAGNTPKVLRPRALKVEDFNWGSRFVGTRDQLVAAGLVAPTRRMPGRGKEQKYWLPLNWSAGYNDACYAGTLPEIPPRWDAGLSLSENGGEEEGLYVVHVNFNWDRDLAVRKRMLEAARAMRTVLAMVEKIAPTPLSEALPRWIKASEGWGKERESGKAVQS